MRNKFVLKGDNVRSGQAVRVFWTGYDWSPSLANAAHFATEFAATESQSVARRSLHSKHIIRAECHNESRVQNVRTCEL